MHEVQGVFCKTIILWTKEKFADPEKNITWVESEQEAQQRKKTRGGALGCGLTQWALARSAWRGRLEGGAGPAC